MAKRPPRKRWIAAALKLDVDKRRERVADPQYGIRLGGYRREVDIQSANRKLHIQLQAGKPVERVAADQFFERSVKWE